MKLHSYNKALAESVVWNLLWLTLGSVLMAICIQSVAAPHGFLSGGVMGVALLVGYWSDTLTPLVWYSVLCVPVYVFGWFCVGKRFLLYTAYGTLCTTLCSFLITFTIPIESEVYATVVGGVLHGAACGIMLRTMGSSGGTDVVAVLLKERWNVPIGQFNFMFNCLLFLTAASRMRLDLIVASMLMMFISASTLEWPAVMMATFFALMKPRAVSTPTTAPSLRRMPWTSQFCRMSTPQASAARAKPQATASWRATPPRCWNEAPSTG